LGAKAFSKSWTPTRGVNRPSVRTAHAEEGKGKRSGPVRGVENPNLAQPVMCWREKKVPFHPVEGGKWPGQKKAGGERGKGNNLGTGGFHVQAPVEKGNNTVWSPQQGRRVHETRIRFVHPGRQ